MKKIDLVKTEAVVWGLAVDFGSSKIDANLTYTDDFDGFLTRLPTAFSAHPTIAGLILNSFDATRLEGDMISISLKYKPADPSAAYPGRPAGTIKRYSMDLTTGEEPLLTNFLFKDLPDTEKSALLELMASSKKPADFTTATTAVTSSEGTKAIAKIRKGVESYYNPGLVWVERFTTKSLTDLDLPRVCHVTDTPPGGCPSGGADRNWLYLGGTSSPQPEGKSWEIEKKWLLSLKGKWDTDLYPAGHSRQLRQEIAISLSVRRVLLSDFTCLGSGS